MNKGREAFRTISEVAAELDVPKHVLRFWETRFSQIKPMKRGGGRRYYRPEDVDLLRGIRTLLHEDGYTIKGLQRVLRQNGVAYVKNCWRAPNTKPAAPEASKGHDIPDLAGEAAEHARRAARQQRATTDDLARVRTKSPLPQAASTCDAQTGEDAKAGKDTKADKSGGPRLSGSERRVLEAILEELEGCRSLLASVNEPCDTSR